MIQIAVDRNPAEALVLELLKSMEDGNLQVRIPALCTPDFVWANSGLPTIRGQSELFEHLKNSGFSRLVPILTSMTHFSADLIHIASDANVVFTERVDHHWDALGHDLMTPHICGVAEIRDGKISAFRDFYDTSCYAQAPTAIQPEFTLANFLRQRSLR